MSLARRASARSNGDHLAEMFEQLGLFASCKIFVNRTDDELRSGSIERGTQQPQESWRCDEDQALELILHTGMLELVS